MNAFEALAAIFPAGWEYTDDKNGLIVSRESLRSLVGAQIVLDSSFPSPYGLNTTVEEFINVTGDDFYTIHWNVIAMTIEASTYKHSLLHGKLHSLAIHNNGFPYVDDDNDEDYEDSSSDDSCSSYSDYETSEGSDEEDEESAYESDSMDM